MEMERFKYRAEEEDLGVVTLVPGPGEGLRAGQSSSAVSLVASDHHGHLGRVQVELLARTHCVAGHIE